jgi:hypothetical protein
VQEVAHQDTEYALDVREEDDGLASPAAGLQPTCALGLSSPRSTGD